MNAILLIEKNLTEELLLTLDKKLDEIVNACNEVSDPDQMGFFDSAEHVTGLGFVTIQTYMTAVYGYSLVKKSDALKLGPKHNGISIAKIINDSANYWKHCNEWPLETNTKRQEKIETTFNALHHSVSTDYPLSGVLAELSFPVITFKKVFELLERWQAEVEKVS